MLAGPFAADARGARFTMRTVAYAINEPRSEAHREHLLTQLSRSLESLRSHDTEVDVTLFAYGAMKTHLLPLAETYGVSVVDKGHYAAALARWCNPEVMETLSFYPVLHKWLALADLPQRPGEQILYVDNDTFFFDAVSRVFDRSNALDFYAREEPFSSRSHAGYRPSYIDEARLFALAEAEGCRPLPTYNLGAVMLNHQMCGRLALVLRDLFSYVARFCLGIVQTEAPESEVIRLHPYLGHLVAHRERLTAGGAMGQPLAYPSSNAWIVEQLGLLLALGTIPGFTHGPLTQNEVLQGVEYHFWPKGERLPPMAHYYTSNTKHFFDWWQTRAGAGEEITRR